MINFLDYLTRHKPQPINEAVHCEMDFDNRKFKNGNYTFDCNSLKSGGATLLEVEIDKLIAAYGQDTKLYVFDVYSEQSSGKVELLNDETDELDSDSDMCAVELFMSDTNDDAINEDEWVNTLGKFKKLINDISDGKGEELSERYAEDHEDEDYEWEGEVVFSMHDGAPIPMYVDEFKCVFLCSNGTMEDGFKDPTPAVKDLVDEYMNAYNEALAELSIVDIPRLSESQPVDMMALQQNLTKIMIAFVDKLAEEDPSLMIAANGLKLTRTLKTNAMVDTLLSFVHAGTRSQIFKAISDHVLKNIDTYKSQISDTRSPSTIEIESTFSPKLKNANAVLSIVHIDETPNGQMFNISFPGKLEGDPLLGNAALQRMEQLKILDIFKAPLAKFKQLFPNGNVSLSFSPQTHKQD